MLQNLIGIVIKTATAKTVKVRVARQFEHPKVHKIVTMHDNYLVHDENSRCSLGDVVRIQACRRMSKRKNFAVAEIIRPAKTWIDPETKEIKR
ncbi:hypothetical protein Glove_327g9 [Diversispora epigaea]|uniref:30S ribosomal protein S17 n=1 Tax=Diversispora epigaea TaxID=1348612 RepID=A0A397HRV1_9GLOM|nr:hypothetical protein Glove_327g9 [Diversispora epigaea]